MNPLEYRYGDSIFDDEDHYLFKQDNNSWAHAVAIAKIKDEFELMQYNFKHGLIMFRDYEAEEERWKRLGPCARAGELEREGL